MDKKTKEKLIEIWVVIGDIGLALQKQVEINAKQDKINSDVLDIIKKMRDELERVKDEVREAFQ